MSEFADAPVEAFDHAIGLRMARWDESVFDVEFFADAVKQVLSGRCFFLTGETICKLIAVIGEQFSDLNGTRFFQFT